MKKRGDLSFSPELSNAQSGAGRKITISVGLQMSNYIWQGTGLSKLSKRHVGTHRARS